MVNFRLESLKYFIVVFTWRHNGHIGVQNNETAAILVYQDNPVELFSLHLKNCLLFREINIATDHVSEDDLFRCSPPEKPRDTMPKSHCRGQTGRVLWVRFSTSIRKHDVAFFHLVLEAQPRTFWNLFLFKTFPEDVYSYCLKKCLNLENTLVIFPVIGKGVSKQVKKNGFASAYQLLKIYIWRRSLGKKTNHLKF